MAAVHQAMLLNKKRGKNARADKSVNICRQPSNVVALICITFIYHFNMLYLQIINIKFKLPNKCNEVKDKVLNIRGCQRMRIA